LKVTANRCEKLRWKGMFIDVSGDEGGESQSGDRIYWCVQSQNCVGPDGQMATDDTCNSLRSCYQAL
jgi:hypothetical protein